MKKNTHLQEMNNFQLEETFYRKKLFYFYFNSIAFYEWLESELREDNWPVPPINQHIPSPDQFICQFNQLKQLKSHQDSFITNIQVLGSKSQVKLDRLFMIWFYWAALFPQSLLVEIQTNLLSLNFIHDLATKLGVDVKSLFGYKPNFKSLESYLDMDTMAYQPDVLTRAICSQDWSNVEFLLINGYNSPIDIEIEMLQSPLVWAIGCQNAHIVDKLQASRVSTSNFLTSSIRKDFQTALALLKHTFNPNLFEPEICDMIKNYESKSGDHLIHDEFLVKLYQIAPQSQVELFYDQIINIGFSFDILDQYCERPFDQFTYSICQSNVSVKIIDMLLNRFLDQVNHVTYSNKIQSHLVLCVEYLIHYYQVSDNRKGLLKLSEINLIMRYLLPRVSSPLKLSEYGIQQRLINDMEHRDDLFSLHEFRLIDLLLSYKCWTSEQDLNSLFASFIYGCNSRKSIYLFICYLLENEFISSKVLLNWLFKIRLNSFFNKDIMTLVTKSLIPLTRSHVDRVKSLKAISRCWIRNRLPDLSEMSLDQLGPLPLHLRSYLRDSVIPDFDSRSNIL